MKVALRNLSCDRSSAEPHAQNAVIIQALNLAWARTEIEGARKNHTLVIADVASIVELGYVNGGPACDG